ncbi:MULTISPECIES: hypothetical protein [unclassified Gilliamella]|uniref:hypothetical protein n=1 Tax=unclassified Gilliamella TaxID=2685620 RepID=UPI001146305A|nr:hypothetical protein [Gilliamella apicola]
MDEAHKHVKSNWQLEKAQRIKPSLWWKQVAQAQAQNPTANTEANIPKLSNLSADGKAWFIHPVAMIDYFNVTENKKLKLGIVLQTLELRYYIPKFVKMR